MQTLGMAEARDGVAGVSVAPVVIGPVEGCEMVHDHFCVFQDIRQAGMFGCLATAFIENAPPAFDRPVAWSAVGASKSLTLITADIAGGKPDSRLKEEGSSQYTYPDGGWLLRHPGPTEFTCDGTWHTGTWEFSSHSPAPDNYGHGSLVPGTVYVQFCWDGPGETPAWHAYFEQFARASY